MGQELARIEGRARALLEAERVALNFIQRLSGTATLTRRFVEAVAEGPSVRVLDTRKTTPGLRLFEKHAVRAGGGENHRFGLFDEAMIKENHAALAGVPVPEALRALRAHVGPGVRITCEARDEAEALARWREARTWSSSTTSRPRSSHPCVNACGQRPPRPAGESSWRPRAG